MHGFDLEAQEVRVFHGVGQLGQIGRGQEFLGLADLAIAAHGNALTLIDLGGILLVAALHGHRAMRDGRQRIAAFGEGHVEGRAAHAGRGARGADLELARGIGLGADRGVHAALLHFEHGLQAACAALAAQLLQLHIGLRLNADQAAVGELDGDERVGCDLDFGAFAELLADLEFGRLRTQLGGDARLSLNKADFCRLQWKEFDRNAKHRSRL